MAIVNYVAENIDHIASIACIGEVGFHVTAHGAHHYLIFHRRVVAPRLIILFRRKTAN